MKSYSPPDSCRSRFGLVPGIVFAVWFALALASPLQTMPLRSIFSTGSWYFRTGQWQADARSLAAGVQFLFDREPDSKPGAAEAFNSLPTPNVSSTTNNIAARPAA